MIGGVTQERVRFTGPRGALAGELAYGEAANAAALLLNPHPYMGGRMDNNLIRHLAVSLPEQGVATLRFDYGGVGESEGGEIDVAASMAEFWRTNAAPQDPAMVEDARAADAWLRRTLGLPPVLIGYSFGAFVAGRLLDAATPAVVLMTPTLLQHDYTALAESAAPKLVVYSDDDFATPMEVSRRWTAAAWEPKRSLCVTGGEHFFRGLESTVGEAIARFLRALQPKTGARA